MTRATPYFSDHEQPGALRRLMIMERHYDPGTIRRLEALGVTEGWSCLEIGAGAGSIARWLAQRVGPTGRVVATDLDTRFLEEAAAATANLEVWRHDVVTDRLPAAAFDVVHVRWVFDLVPERQRCLAKLAAALKPGGWLLDEEPDMFPAATGSAEAYRRFVAGLAVAALPSGLDSEWARTLPAALTAAGLVDVGAEVDVDLYRGGSPLAESRHLGCEQLREPAVGSGALSEGEFDEGLACLADPGLWLMDFANVAAWGRAP